MAKWSADGPTPAWFSLPFYVHHDQPQRFALCADEVPATGRRLLTEAQARVMLDECEATKPLEPRHEYLTLITAMKIAQADVMGRQKDGQFLSDVVGRAQAVRTIE